MQHVKFDNVPFSNIKYLMSIPQGPVLGLFLFSLYINDLPHQYQDAKLLFMQVTLLIIHRLRTTGDNGSMLTALERISQWLEKACLNLNVNETKSMFSS